MITGITERKSKPESNERRQFISAFPVLRCVIPCMKRIAIRLASPPPEKAETGGFFWYFYSFCVKTIAVLIYRHIVNVKEMSPK